MADQTFTDRVRAIGLPLDQIIVIGSGVLDATGIREASDVDLAVSPELFAAFETDPKWQAHTADWGERYFQSADCEAWAGWELPDGTKVNYPELLSSTIELDGVRFTSLEYVRRWKELKGRDKDKKDIALIDEYLSQHSHDE